MSPVYSVSDVPGLYRFSTKSIVSTHPGVRTFVANKGSTPIRQGCHKAVEAIFSSLFGFDFD
jgi:hypothetical protein